MYDKFVLIFDSVESDFHMDYCKFVHNYVNWGMSSVIQGEETHLKTHRLMGGLEQFRGSQAPGMLCCYMLEFIAAKT